MYLFIQLICIVFFCDSLPNETLRWKLEKHTVDLVGEENTSKWLEWGGDREENVVNCLVNLEPQWISGADTHWGIKIISKTIFQAQS